MSSLEEAIAMGRGVERPFHCHVHDDSNASASVNVAKGVWHCYACGAAGRTGSGNINAAMKAVIESMRNPAVTNRHHPEGWLDIFDADHASSYWANRVGAETAEVFRCGTHPFLGLPTYPIRDRWGRVLGVTLRMMADATSRKYEYPMGVAVSQCLFGYELAAQAAHDSTVVIVEGAGDVMACYSAGIRGVVGSFGCGLHAPQVQMLQQLSPRTVVVAYDNDTAGQRGAGNAVAILNDAGLTARRHAYRGTQWKDFGSMPRLTIAEELSIYDMGTAQQPSRAVDFVA